MVSAIGAAAEGTLLSAADFASYFEAVHGARPFPWQTRLLEHVAGEGRWPTLLDLPTGSGKTAAIDVALFHLALDAARSPEARRAARRIVLVVDRRTVVDQAHERGKRIRKRLEDASGGVLASVRARLASLCDDGEDFLAVAQLRGGMPRDIAWARRPDQPLVAVSTVDQVGSRLLFRGYGVSDAMRPIQAGLLGQDALFLLDEVHLSQPFLETLEALRGFRERAGTMLPDRWQFVAMSATPGKPGTGFGLTGEDHADERLAVRLEASKPADCELVRGPQFAEVAAKRARALGVPGRCVGVVVNRVAAALDIYRHIAGANTGARVFLVTGRMRPLDRADLEAELSPVVRSGRLRTPGAPPVFVVATQCIEAGADFDFDTLVTECASLDALRQRFGRLNRLGSIADARGLILARSDAVGKDARDFVYGEALVETWRWLEASPHDFGIEAMQRSLPTGDDLRRMLPPMSRAPVMLPSHLDAWAQTAPTPRPDPDVSLWLHGVDQRQDADVQVVWRADISAEMLKQADEGEKEILSTIRDRIEVCPPSGLEALAVPIAAARAWLRGSTAPPIADVEGAASEEEDARPDPRATPRVALLWRGDESRLVCGEDLTPGMTLVVPSAYGGLTSGTWDPSAKDPVSDLGDRARWVQSGRPSLRLAPTLVPEVWGAPEPSAPDDPDGDERGLVVEWLRSMGEVEGPPWMRDVLKELSAVARRGARRLGIVRVSGVGEKGAPDAVRPYLALVVRGGSEPSTEDDTSSLTGVEVTLRDHMCGVARWAKRFAIKCGLSPALVRDLEIAGRWHDAGKVDPRFQRLLRGGSPLADVAAEPLAKSGMVAGDREVRRRARERSGYPKGGRHELSSVSLLEQAPSLLSEAADRDLVLHLVASHHGWCRPFAPVVDDPEPVDLTFDAEGLVVQVTSAHGLGALDSGATDRFWRLIRKYGWFGLAWLEAILRLADHRRSEWEQRRGSGDEEGEI